MESFEYLIDRPSIEDDKFYDGVTWTTKTSKSLFGKEKIEDVMVRKFITEQEYLNRKGSEGWELVSVLKNSMTYNIREYYFKRKINQ